MIFNQYDVIVVNLDPTVGSEIKKTRPCIIISPNEMNRYLNTLVIAPITSASKNYPTRVEIVLKSQISQVALDQIRTIDKQRVIKILSNLTEQEVINVKSVLRETYVD